MARLCIRTAPNGHPTDPQLDLLRTQPGDVVEVVADDHVFSLAERTNGQYRIIDVPGVPASEFLHLKEPLLSADEVTIMRRRGRGFNLNVLNSPAWSNRASATKAQIDAITIERG